MRTSKTNVLAICLMAGAISVALAQQNDTSQNKQTPAPPAEAKPVEQKPAQAAEAVKPEPVRRVTSETEKGLRLNFRGVPLETVLNYLSDAAGFIIVLETKVEGKVDVWSNQPLSKDEAVDLLNTILNKNKYTAIRNGRTLTIVSLEDAKKRNIPVKKGADIENIPVSDEMVTQIIPVRHANDGQLTANLQPLLGTYADM